MKQTKTSLLSIAGQFDNLELEGLRILRDILNKRITEKVGDTRSTLKVGDTIKANHHKAYGMTFKIIKLNNKKAKCQCVTGGSGIYNIPYSLIIPA